MLKSPQATDWLSASDQQAWFDRFKTTDQGIRFNQFQEFLKATIYVYFARFNAQNEDASAKNQAGEAIKFSYQQEMIIFKVFDAKKDNVIDRDEFAHLCQAWLEKTYRRSCALVVVDVQNDFVDGSLALINGPAGQDGAEVVPVINKIIEKCPFDAIVYTQDWHPIDHIGFYDNLHLRPYTLKRCDEATNGQGKESSAATNSGKATVAANEDRREATRFKLKKLATRAQLFDTVLFNEGQMEQKIWPVHCVQNSWGAELHPKLKVIPNAVRIYKGTLSQVDAYSAFWDNMRLNETGLRQKLSTRNIDDVFFCGLALDYCVAASAIDSAKAGFTTFVIEDACRGIDQLEMERRRNEMLDCGIFFINSDTINSYLLQVKDSFNNSANAIYNGGRDGISHGSNELGEMQKLTKRHQNSPLSPITNLKNEPALGSDGDSVNNRELDRMLLVNICFKRALALSA